MKTPLLQRPIKELVAGLAKIEIPLAAELPAATPATMKAKKTRRDSETPKTMSSELSL